MSHRSFSLLLVSLALSSQLLAQTDSSPATLPSPPVSVPAQADLRIQKVYQPKPQAFVITITNYGPQTAPGPISFNDVLPAPAAFTTPVAAAPWTCTNAYPGQNGGCSYGGPLAPGNSITIVLPFQLNGTSTNVQNCAALLAPNVKDPDDRNNRDCACVDVNPCRDLAIDLTTGRENGADLAIGAPDQEWRLGPSFSNPSIAIAGPIPPWLTPAPGRWINALPPSGTKNWSATSGHAASQTYRFNFQLASPWTASQCRLRFDYAADNCVRFKLNGNFITPAPTNCNSFSAFNATQTYNQPIAAGTHSLEAVVTNVSSYSGLYVRGTVTCHCKVHPPPLDTETATD
jgi:Domain of unknown function DUF11